MKYAVNLEEKKCKWFVSTWNKSRLVHNEAWLVVSVHRDVIDVSQPLNSRFLDETCLLCNQVRGP